MRYTEHGTADIYYIHCSSNQTVFIKIKMYFLTYFLNRGIPCTLPCSPITDLLYGNHLKKEIQSCYFPTYIFPNFPSYFTKQSYHELQTPASFGLCLFQPSTSNSSSPSPCPIALGPSSQVQKYAKLQFPHQGLQVQLPLLEYHTTHSSPGSLVILVSAN